MEYNPTKIILCQINLKLKLSENKIIRICKNQIYQSLFAYILFFRSHQLTLYTANIVYKQLQQNNMKNASIPDDQFHEESDEPDHFDPEQITKTRSEDSDDQQEIQFNNKNSSINNIKFYDKNLSLQSTITSYGVYILIGVLIVLVILGIASFKAPSTKSEEKRTISHIQNIPLAGKKQFKDKSASDNHQYIQLLPNQNTNKIKETSLLDSDHEYVQIPSDTGQTVTLKYKKPIVIRLDKVNEPEKFGNIGPIDVQNAEKYIQSQPTHADLVYSYVNPKNITLASQAQYLYYSKKYNIDTFHLQLPLCIVSPYRNFFKPDYRKYLGSLEYQNYSNFQIFMIDDLSDDNSVEKLQKLVKQKYPRVNNRLTILKNAVKTGALGNRDIVSRNLCRNDSIIVEYDADDYIIGRQVFNVYNTYYHEHPELWFMYSNYIHINPARIVTLGNNGQISDQVYENNNYRTKTKYWLTIHLRSYLKKLYMKIPLSYLLEEPDQYYLWASDRFTMYALTQLSGKNHTHFLPEQVYYYNFPNDGKRPNCEMAYIRYSDYLCRMQRPLKNLASLDDPVDFMEYNPPQQIKQAYGSWKTRLDSCVQKFHLTLNTISK